MLGRHAARDLRDGRQHRLLQVLTFEYRFVNKIAAFESGNVERWVNPL